MSIEDLYADSTIVPGQRYRFDYPIEFTTLDDYSAHRGQTVTVLRPCTAQEADVIWDKIDSSDSEEQIMDRMFKAKPATAGLAMRGKAN